MANFLAASCSRIEQMSVMTHHLAKRSTLGGGQDATAAGMND